MRLTSVFVTAVLVAGALSSCKQMMNVTTSAYIVGESNDIQTITPKNKAAIPKHELNAVVVLATMIDGQKRKFCSGVMIGPAKEGGNNRILTNHHCFAGEEEDKQKVSEKLLPGHCTSTKIYFGFYKGETDHREVAECQDGTFRNDYDGDLAVFTLKQNPPDPYEPAALWPGDEIPKDRTARVIHFPAIDPLEENPADKQAFEPSIGIPLPLGQLTDQNCKTLGYFPKTEWDLDKALRMGVKHTCDLKKGSSGSALWDVESDTVLGINWGGITLRYKNPDRIEIHNVATQAKYIREFLNGEEHTSGKVEPSSGDQTVQNRTFEIERAEKGEKAKDALKSCGAVGSLGERPLAQGLLIILFGMPLAVIALTARRRRTD